MTPTEMQAINEKWERSGFGEYGPNAKAHVQLYWDWDHQRPSHTHSLVPDFDDDEQWLSKWTFFRT